MESDRFLGSDSVEGDRLRLRSGLRVRALGDSEDEEGGLRTRALGDSESEEGGRRGLRTRALGGSGGLRARALGLGASGGSESEEGSRLGTFLGGFRLGAGAGSGAGTGAGTGAGAGAGAGAGTGAGAGAGTGAAGGVLGLFRLPLGRPAFRFGRASIYSWQYFYSYGRVITNSKDTACPLRSTISSAWSRIWNDKCRSSRMSVQ